MGLVLKRELAVRYRGAAVLGIHLRKAGHQCSVVIRGYLVGYCVQDGIGKLIGEGGASNKRIVEDVSVLRWVLDSVSLRSICCSVVWVLRRIGPESADVT
jgi:hypothetical protein